MSDKIDRVLLNRAACRRILSRKDLDMKCPVDQRVFGLLEIQGRPTEIPTDYLEYLRRLVIEKKYSEPEVAIEAPMSDCIPIESEIVD